MTQKGNTEKDYNSSSPLFFCFLFSMLIAGAIFSIMFFVPELKEPEISEIYVVNASETEDEEDIQDISQYIHDYVSEVTFQSLDNVKDKVAYITPVPGGVGPMTVAMLLKNVNDTYKRMIASK